VHDKQVRRRRAVLALLVAVSLILLTAYFGESPSSPLHSVQRGIVEVLSPIQQGASKVLSPFRDVANWFSNTLNAKSENTQLRRENETLRSELAQYQQRAINYPQLAAEVKLYNGPTSISSYEPVTADVITRSATVWYQTINVDKGTDDGVHVNDPVVGDGALVGKVTLADSSVSIVTLITDPTFAAAAEVQLQGSGEETGVLRPDTGNPNELVLQDLPKPTGNQQVPLYGEQVVTAGFDDPSDPELRDLYPAALPIGTVSNANIDDLDNNGQIEISPDANLRDLSFVQILTAPKAGTDRAEVGAP
jgi:rod shape-determining protein MreC